MNFNEFMFFMQFAVFIACFLLLVYNVFCQGQFLEKFKSIMVLIVMCVCYLISLVIVLTDAALNGNSTILGFSMLLNLQRGIFVLGFILFAVSLFYVWKHESLKNFGARNAQEERKAYKYG